MELEYVKNTLFIRINTINKKIFNKFNYINSLLNKDDIERIVINLNNIKSNYFLTDSILSLNESIKERRKKLYLVEVNNKDFSLLNSNIEILSSEYVKYRGEK